MSKKCDDVSFLLDTVAYWHWTDRRTDGRKDRIGKTISPDIGGLPHKVIIFFIYNLNLSDRVSVPILRDCAASFHQLRLHLFALRKFMILSPH